MREPSGKGSPLAAREIFNRFIRMKRLTNRAMPGILRPSIETG
jgi:hypothetical protein